MNRRGLFKRLGVVAAVVAVAPAVTVQAETEQYADVVSRGVQAARDATAVSGDEWLFVPRGYVEMREATFALREANQAYQRGLTDGLNGAIDRSFSVLHLATVTVASAEGKYVARLTDGV
jgi:hypothetical protein